MFVNLSILKLAKKKVSQLQDQVMGNLIFKPIPTNLQPPSSGAQLPNT